MPRATHAEVPAEFIAADFDVEQIASDENWILFGRERRGLFHLVEYNTEGNVITQHHLPHFAIARAMENATAGRQELKEGWQTYVAKVQGNIAIGAQDDGQAYLVIGGEAIPFACLGGDFPERFAKASKRLIAARKNVSPTERGYEIPGVKTHSGNPVESVSKEMIDGIALEKSMRRRLNARIFALYSAFCSHMDFPSPLDRRSCAQEFVDNHFEFYGDRFPEDGLVEVAQEVQRRLFPFPIWGPGIAVEMEEAVNAVQVAFSKLDPVQATQVTLLNGMQAASLFLALGVVSGVVSFADYKDAQTAHLQPYSEEEQFRLISASYIELFGAVARPCRGYRGLQG